jgi:Raf kinase inhibitor-like YbhB/YbcL family protein
MRYSQLFLYLLIILFMTSFTPKTKLTVTSTSFKNDGNIPSKYSCEGEQASPPLHVTNIPAGTKCLAIILHDPDAPLKGGFTHWVLWNTDKSGNIPENFKDGTMGLNSTGKSGYIGMCPPSGTHHYHFMVYALDTKLNIDKNSDKAALEKAMEGHILSEGELVGLYKKSGK